MKDIIMSTPKSALDRPINHVNDQVINIPNYSVISYKCDLNYHSKILINYIVLPH